ncbi:cobalt-precorrin-6A reductase [Streptomyces sp. NBC_00056]|uniref:cobalt-precorrin-6A reductase n=1 Tax=unclassified Streptomyces TaxID=2593676 RepID=UPI0022504F76|nr:MULTISPECIES: cobalt-precorrin-6A reductase [unclassified Streptomyces]MCX5441590.1 cobalt-precorrin-6A reductase [Streptomyces sp. NBC_00063]WUB92128.1 cobalt-precorrin-6A reductase [Streptomyces sp. NBC_00569]
MHVLILGGTTEARRLAQALTAGHPGWRVTSSLAGRVARPLLPEGEVRTGGFGGADGLARALRELQVDALIDATHPFAGTISFHAAQAAATAHVPLLALRRPGWVPAPDDDWHHVNSLEEAATALPTLGTRAFLTVGRLGLPPFASIDDVHFLIRSVDAPEPPLPPHSEVLLGRGPFTPDGERELLRTHRIDVLVTKDSGGEATAPKLVAAREARIPVLVVRRPQVPAGVAVVGSVAEAVEWAGNPGSCRPSGTSEQG